jgi:hypothetical protein
LGIGLAGKIKMIQFTESLGLIAPYYNLVFVAIVIILFVYFFKNHNKNVYIKPWKLLFAAILVFVFEEVFTVTGISAYKNVYTILHPILEMIIISLFIYMVLLQKEYLKSKK